MELNFYFYIVMVIVVNTLPLVL